MSNFRPGVVIPLGAGRRENVAMTLRSLHEQTRLPEAIVIVADGPEAAIKPHGLSIPTLQVIIPKHEPGLEQPRNVGVRMLEHHFGGCNAAWFIDSDIIFAQDALAKLTETWEGGEERIIQAPYEWLAPGQREVHPELYNDPRWAMLNEERWRDPAAESIGELNVGLGCFSGNLVWPIEEFTRIGGFWNEIHHGRCEDGELGLRAVSLGVPIACCPGARGYHLWHPINHELATERNARDVPMLNARHPWVEGEGICVVERDGRRFEQRCDGCGQLINTLDWWSHRPSCQGQS